MRIQTDSMESQDELKQSLHLKGICKQAHTSTHFLKARYSVNKTYKAVLSCTSLDAHKHASVYTKNTVVNPMNDILHKFWTTYWNTAQNKHRCETGQCLVRGFVCMCWVNVSGSRYLSMFWSELMQLSSFNGLDSLEGFQVKKHPRLSLSLSF